MHYILFVILLYYHASCEAFSEIKCFNVSMFQCFKIQNFMINKQLYYEVLLCKALSIVTAWKYMSLFNWHWNYVAGEIDWLLVALCPVANISCIFRQFQVREYYIILLVNDNIAHICIENLNYSVKNMT